MEPFYYNHMNKNQQAAYRAMQQGLTNLSDEFQIPRLEGSYSWSNAANLLPV